MKQFEHYYTLSSKWHNELAQKMGATIKDNKLMRIPESIGKGYSLFLEVMPGMSVLLLDLVLSAPIKIKRLKSDDDLRIMHFDLSDEVNSIEVQDAVYKIGYKANLGFAVTSNDIENTHQHAIGKRIFTLRLLVDKKILNPLINNLHNESVHKNKFDKNALYFCDHIDSHSKILMHAIKNKSVLNESFDFYLRGVALRLLSNFGNRYAVSTSAAARQGIKKTDLDAFNTSKNYLLDNLKSTFPGVDFLAKMSKMSITKYKALFQTIEETTPNMFFGKNKMSLAHQLLASGSYLTLKEVVNELNYKRLDYFVSKYFDNFGRKPSEDFVVKKSEPLSA